MAKERAPEPSGWVLARRFSDAGSARSTYESVRDLLLIDDIDASVFRFTLAGTSFVATIGEHQPDHDSLQKLEQLLSVGVAAEVPPQVLQHLRDRRRRVSALRFDFFERRSGDL